MVSDFVSQRSQERTECAIEVIAVSAPTFDGDPHNGVNWIDVPGLSRMYPHRLVRDTLNVATMEAL
jgi:hypothetical protein